MTSELQQIMVDSIDNILSDQVDKNLLDHCEAGNFPSALWQTVCENGFHQLAMPESGAELVDAFAVLKVAGYHAAPLPLPEALLGNRWSRNSGESFVSIGELDGDKISGVPWSQHAKSILGVAKDHHVVSAQSTPHHAGMNVAFEPRDTINSKQSGIACNDQAYALMALSRICLASGALDRVLELTIQYVGEREQFGRPIAKFQAVQHNLAIAAAEVAAASRACDGAMESIGEKRFELEVAAGKGRVGEAITVVTEIAHQLHGAMGFTHEHSLHHYTRRLWSWREEYGDETYWQAKLGQHIHRLGADNAWDFIATLK